MLTDDWYGAKIALCYSVICYVGALVMSFCLILCCDDFSTLIIGNIDKPWLEFMWHENTSLHHVRLHVRWNYTGVVLPVFCVYVMYRWLFGCLSLVQPSLLQKWVSHTSWSHLIASFFLLATVMDWFQKHKTQVVILIPEPRHYRSDLHYYNLEN